MDRITYIPGALPPFPPRAFNPASISPGRPPRTPCCGQRGEGERERERERDRDRDREREKDREKEREREHREREREREHREREQMVATSEYMRAGRCPRRRWLRQARGTARRPTPWQSKDKGPPTKLRIEQELRAHGKTIITAANFIDVIITRQIASDKESHERGSQSSDSSSSLSSSRYEAPGSGAIEVISPAGSPALDRQAGPFPPEKPAQTAGTKAPPALTVSGTSRPAPSSPSQAEAYGQVPKTHRVMTLADHISHIITQDFAMNQDAPQASPATSSPGTFQSSAPSALSRAKMPSRYSPESQGPPPPPHAPHHPRASSRVSPENASDKPRARPGKSPDRGGPMESYEPISPPQSYPGLDKQEAMLQQAQRREAEHTEQSVISVDAEDIIKSLYIFGRTKKLSQADLEMYQKQVECLGLPEPSFKYDQKQDICPDEEKPAEEVKATNSESA
ncbi:hypothetical protein COCON_G00075470 [Conger conger]|uniref:Uncharacterized protein n=1 Tax=Conger conger TaxID=82655 RepID=A0A9Q1I257_CONCO|nr:hypothetical protein COCON_G00075470 [Conger conger]